MALRGCEAFLNESQMDKLRIKDKDGEIMINLEDAARGLGFTQNKKGIEYVRWDRINEYLNDFGFPTSGENEANISESVFYLLAMKANNEAAKEFQIKVATEIIPGYRKGIAMMPNFKDPVKAARAWADERESKQLAIAEMEHQKRKLQISEEKRSTLQLFHDREWDKEDRESLYPRWRG